MIELVIKIIIIVIYLKVKVSKVNDPAINSAMCDLALGLLTSRRPHFKVVRESGKIVNLCEVVIFIIIFEGEVSELGLIKDDHIVIEASMTFTRELR